MRTNRLQDPTTSIHGQRRTGVIALLLGAILIAGCVPTTPAAAVILRLPAPITVNADDAAGAVVTFDVTATTAGGVTLPVTCESVSSTGGRFPIGETTVTCSASNGSVRQVGWFVVTVREWIPPLPVIGAGSTFAAIALEQWRADSRQRLGLDVRYFATGSVNGQIGFSRGDFDFAASGIPVQPSNQPPFNYSYVPIVAGGTALAYNVTDADGREIKNLKLSPETIGKIFTEPGRMFWDDPAIIADNPDLAGRLPRKELVRVAQSGGSGTTAALTNYLYNVARPAWDALTRYQQEFIVEGPGGKYITEFDARFREATQGNSSSEIVKWEFVRGSDVVAQTIATTGGQLLFNGYIGYVETGYALQKNLPIAYVNNASRVPVLPTARNVAVALLDATRNPDGTQNLLGVALSTRPDAYPISSYDYLLVRTDATSSSGLGKGATIGRYVIYCITEGQRLAKDLGYSPLPPNLVQQGLDVVARIPGAPAPPPLGDWGRFYEQLTQR